MLWVVWQISVDVNPDFFFLIFYSENVTTEKLLQIFFFPLSAVKTGQSWNLL